MFWGRLDQNSGFYSIQKLPLTYNAGPNAFFFDRIFFKHAGNEHRTKTDIKSRTGSILGQIRFGVTCPWAVTFFLYTYRLIMEKMLLTQ